MRTSIHSKKGIELSINYMVTLILAISAFAFGIVIIKTITAGGSTQLTLTQDKLNEKIGELSCTARDKICTSNNNRVINAGEYVISGVYVFNYLNEPVALQIDVEPKRAYDASGNKIADFGPGVSSDVMPKSLHANIPMNLDPKKQGQLGIAVTTYDATPKGTYLFKVTAHEDTDQTNAGFADISDEISVTVK